MSQGNNKCQGRGKSNKRENKSCAGDDCSPDQNCFAQLNLFTQMASHVPGAVYPKVPKNITLLFSLLLFVSLFRHAAIRTRMPLKSATRVEIFG